MDGRTLTLAGVLAGVVIAAVVAVFLLAPPGTDSTPTITAIIGVPVTLFTGLSFVQARINGKTLNGQMERHLDSAKEIGVEAAQAAASSHDEVIKAAVSKAAKEAVNQVMTAAMAQERAAKARRQQGGR